MNKPDKLRLGKYPISRDYRTTITHGAADNTLFAVRLRNRALSVAGCYLNHSAVVSS